MTRLGPQQLRLLKLVGTTAALVVADRRTRRLCDLGLMREAAPGAFVHITPAGLRALADAAEAGRVELFTLPTGPDPSYYRAPLRRPTGATGWETFEQVAWDMCDTWPTTAEWLAWVRRRDGGPRYYSRGRWHYPVRPIIAAHQMPWSTLKVRRLP